ncbi:jg25952, partial [Pararge aegeria aegeria]
MFGANGLELCRIVEEELGLMQREIETGVERPKQEISELLPEEA